MAEISILYSDASLNMPSRNKEYFITGDEGFHGLIIKEYIFEEIK